MRTAINLERLREEIRVMTRSHLIYKVLKEELSRLGFWKSKPRGNPKKGYQVSKGRGNV